MNTAAREALVQELKAKGANMRRELPKARHLPSVFYASPEVEALEKEKIFLTHWLCLGREEEVAKPGDYITMRLVGEPLIVSRDKDNNVVVMRNQCLHRGVEVAQGKGSTRNFTCPYHAWGYDIGGKLLTAAYMQRSEADLSNVSLPRLKSATWRGWIFATFNENPQSFEDFIAPYEKELWFFKTDECVLGDKLVLELDCNWKFVAENLLDRYHTGTLHAKTFGKLRTSKPEEFTFTSIPGGGSNSFSNAAPMTADGSQAFVALPWMQEHGNIATKSNIFPNLNLSSRSDSIRLWALWPLSPGRTQIISYLLFYKTALERPDFPEQLDIYRNYMKSIIAEDQSAVESLQKVAESYMYEPGPLSHLEGPIHNLLNHYLDTIEA
ncbi:MAG: ring hydroxylating alpha subunit family protein [Ramlibacter sp.]|jgi:phenylpropionate dioxygenase-like ring-hydroxylating dioxygenase large terminal subunit|nr:ring hydroxylating alpha subunit family protein [Ramlibacter sp.]